MGKIFFLYPQGRALLNYLFILSLEVGQLLMKLHFCAF